MARRTLLVMSTPFILGLVIYLYFQAVKIKIDGHGDLEIDQSRFLKLQIQAAQNDSIDPECNEAEYSFDNKGSTSIFTDRKLWKQCGVNTYSSKRKSEFLKYPMIRKKCSTVNATLISRHYKERPVNTSFYVPNIVHYVLFGNDDFTFLNYLSFRSCDRFIKPNYIFIHGDYDIRTSHGPWWDKMLEEVPNVFFVWWPKIKYIQKQSVLHLAHMSDIIRLLVIQENGGIYLDTDVIVLKSFDHLRQTYPLTLGQQDPERVANGIIISAPRHPFLCVWYHGYRSYNPKRRDAWGYFSTMTGHKLSKLFPKLVHIEERSLMHPSWIPSEVKFLFTKHYDWSNNYAIHVWKQKGPVPKEPRQIMSLDTTLGEIMRYIYLGNQSLSS